MISKVQSILSYIGILWLLAFFAGKEQGDDFSRYNLKQGLGLWIAATLLNLAGGLVIYLILTLDIPVGKLSLLVFIIMIIGIINTANEVKKPLLLVDEIIEDKFDFIDK
ncbi:MAG: DUF4870 domain-containing protein [Sphingobacterium sp.]|jgi:hypothetical protein|nr:DUF4870 domain-containing protein [Sphingobacterium sp.]